jgi:muramoyltetrapeptide carboxypeptidase
MTPGKKIVQPSFLQAGDKVALVSPAYWIPKEAIQAAAETLRNWGLEPVIGPHTNKMNVNAYAGTADERAADLLWALNDDSIKGIICSRGGYGSIHLLRRIAEENYSRHPKWLMGHGDITFLLHRMVSAGVMCIHGPMAFQIDDHQNLSTNIARDILMGTIPQYEVPCHPQNRCGHAEGILIGGNLSSISAIAGTPYFIPPTKDVILFFEDEEESLHNIDRLFYQLRLLSNFPQVKGIIFGMFSTIKFDMEFNSVEEMLVAHLADCDIPICCGFPVGSNSNIPLIEGAPCALDVTPEKTILTFQNEGERKRYNIAEAGQQLFR